mgnify:CR=1 FL=1
MAVFTELIGSQDSPRPRMPALVQQKRSSRARVATFHRIRMTCSCGGEQCLWS